MKTFSGQPPRQREDELAAFVALLREQGVCSYLEVGACYGDTFHAVVSSLPVGSRGVAVDLPAGAWGKPRSRRELEAAVADLVARGYEASAVFGDSQSAGVHQLAAIRGPYDAVLIDGDHRYEGVSRDWQLYAPMARIVAFHDIAGDGQATRRGTMAVEVPRLWRELKGGHRHAEILGEVPGMGIGVLWR